MYYLKLDDENNIIGFLVGSAIDDSYIEISESEYIESMKYEKFDKDTREFSCLIEKNPKTLNISEMSVDDKLDLIIKYLGIEV